MDGKFRPKIPFVNQKLMHPRNIYQNRIDFGDLANKYPEFRKIAKKDIRGKITIDFKDEETLRVLSKTLLKKDFTLDVNIPRGYLVPTVPLRLNYILWLEDMLKILPNSEKIHGIDIGTGASCIYMLLAAKKDNWNMIGTEIDADSVKYAQENIDKNNLNHLLRVLLTKDEDPLFQFLNHDDTDYSFCMCNPPFYSSQEDFGNITGKRRNMNCPPPKNIQTGKHSELSTDGGEIDFITRIIEESLQWKTRIKIYTSMVGHKKNIFLLVNILKEKGIKKFVSTEFVQGNTNRWAIAWTFLKDIKIEDMGTGVTPCDNEPNKQCKNKNQHKPIIYQFTNPDKYPEKQNLLQHLRKLFSELKVKYIEKIKKEHVSFEITAFENTWSHQRQKRREMLRYQRQEAQSSSSSTEEINLNEFFTMSTLPGSAKKRPAETELSSNASEIKKPKLENDELLSKEPLVKVEIVVQLNDLNYYQLAFLFLEGSKNSMYQVFQFLKNRVN